MNCKAAFYTLNRVTDNGNSAIGPLIIEAIVDTMGEIGLAFEFLSLPIVLPIPIVWMVDMDEGKSDIANAVEKEKRIESEAYNPKSIIGYPKWAKEKVY